jgi:hypothetical protein
MGDNLNQTSFYCYNYKLKVSKKDMSPEVQEFISKAISQSSGGGGDVKPSDDPKNPNYIPPNLRVPSVETPPSNSNGILAAKPPGVSSNALNIAKENNPEFTKALGGIKSDDPMAIYNSIMKEAGISTEKPKGEYDNLTQGQIANKLQKEATEFLGPNPSAENRKRLMAEKANAADEAVRTQAMRMAEFFAMWGSTPGNTIVAGLNALKNKVPDFISDKKEASKMRREIDKSIADLDQVDYLEKSGRFDEAGKLRAESRKEAMTWGTEVLKLTSGVAINAVKEVGDTQRNRETIAGRLKEASIIASNRNNGGGSSKELDRLYDNIEQTERNITLEKKDETYKKNENIVNRGIPKDASSKMIERYNNAKEALNTANNDFNTRRQRAQTAYDIARGVKPETKETKVDKSKLGTPQNPIKIP